MAMTERGVPRLFELEAEGSDPAPKQSFTNASDGFV